MNIITISHYGNSFDLVFCTIISCVSAGIRTLVSISDGLEPYIFQGKMARRGVWRKIWMEW